MKIKQDSIVDKEMIFEEFKIGINFGDKIDVCTTHNLELSCSISDTYCHNIIKGANPTVT